MTLKKDDGKLNSEMCKIIIIISSSRSMLSRFLTLASKKHSLSP